MSDRTEGRIEEIFNQDSRLEHQRKDLESQCKSSFSEEWYKKYRESFKQISDQYERIKDESLFPKWYQYIREILCSTLVLSYALTTTYFLVDMAEHERLSENTIGMLAPVYTIGILGGPFLIQHYGHEFLNWLGKKFFNVNDNQREFLNALPKSIEENERILNYFLRSPFNS